MRSLKTFQNETAKDSELNELTDIVQHGWLDTQDKVSKDVRLYWNYRDEISYVG